MSEGKTLHPRLKQFLTRIQNFWNSPIEISIFNFRQVQNQKNSNLPRPTAFVGTIEDEDTRKITKIGNSSHVSHPEGWLKLVAKNGEEVTTQLRKKENSDEYEISISALPNSELKK